MVKENLYCYRAVVNAVDSGDSCEVDIDLGLGHWLRNEKFHLSRIYAPIQTGHNRTAGLVARDFLRSQINGREIYIQTIKNSTDLAGLYQIEIWIESEQNGWININDLMVCAGQANYQDYCPQPHQMSCPF